MPKITPKIAKQIKASSGFNQLELYNGLTTQERVAIYGTNTRLWFANASAVRQTPGSSNPYYKSRGYAEKAGGFPSYVTFGADRSLIYKDQQNREYRRATRKEAEEITKVRLGEREELYYVRVRTRAKNIGGNITYPPRADETVRLVRSNEPPFSILLRQVKPLCATI
jgi:hypothetical protein